MKLHRAAPRAAHRHPVSHQPSRPPSPPIPSVLPVTTMLAHTTQRLGKHHSTSRPAAAQLTPSTETQRPTPTSCPRLCVSPFFFLHRAPQSEQSCSPWRCLRPHWPWGSVSRAGINVETTPPHRPLPDEATTPGRKRRAGGEEGSKTPHLLTPLTP